MAKFFIASIAVGCALFGTAEAQYYPFDLPKTDAALDEEVKRIEALPVPPIEIVPSQLQEALSNAQQFAGESHKTVEGVRVVDNTKVASLIDAVMKSANPCDSRKLATALNALRKEIPDEFSLRAPGIDVRGPDFEKGVSPEDQASADLVRSDLSSSTNSYFTCDRMTAQFFSSPEFRRGVEAFLRIYSQHVRNIEGTLQAEKPRAEKLAAAWSSRAKKLESALQSQRKVTADLFVTQLPWVIGLFGLFALLVIATVRLFSPDVQMEWVASGQVTQFASVMVLLIVVSTLGIIGKIEGQTVGTLLGGIAGYVLSQGVGRAAARAVERQAQRAPSAVTKDRDPVEEAHKGDSTKQTPTD